MDVGCCGPISSGYAPDVLQRRELECKFWICNSAAQALSPLHQSGEHHPYLLGVVGASVVGDLQSVQLHRQVFGRNGL